MVLPARAGSFPCVVVGGGLAGLRACEGLRKGGYDGEIVVLGAEEHLPYNRPPLSKAALTSSGPVGPEPFRISPALQDVTWRLGEPVVGSDLAEGTVTTVDGTVIAWSGLVVASGLRPRDLGLPGPQIGRHRLRTVDDAVRLRQEIRPGSTVVIVGAGFIGCELAMTLSALGARVQLVDPGEAPLEQQLGPLLGTVVQERLLAAGVTLHLGSAPAVYLGARAVEAVGLGDGSIVPTTVVVEAVGSVPNTDWLAGNGLDLSDGVVCDDRLRVTGRGDVVACGDIARHPHPLRTGANRRMEHWTGATDSGRLAGRTLARLLTAQQPDAHVAPGMPSFWSDLGSLRIQGFGLPGAGMGDIRVLEGDPHGDIAVGYHHDGVLVGVVMFGLPNRHQHYRALIAETIRLSGNCSLDRAG